MRNERLVWRALVLWLVYTLLMLHIPCSVFCRYLPQPVKLSLDSRYFVYTLTWQAGPGSPEGLQYFVIVRTINNDWKMVKGCEMVRSPLFCNLTSVFSDLQETYYTNVTAYLKNETSIPANYVAIKPAMDTIPQSPLIDVVPCNKSLCVYLHSPSERLYNIYKSFAFELNVTSERGDQFVKNTVGLNNVVLEHLAPGLQYCISVNVKGHPATTASTCASIVAPGNHTDAAVTVVFILVLLLTSLCPVLLIASGTICLKADLPSFLATFQYPFKVQLLVCSSVEFITHLSIEPTLKEHIKIDGEREEDRENEVNDVSYEGRMGCKEDVNLEGLSNDRSSSSCLRNAVKQYEDQINHINECVSTPENILNDVEFVPPNTAELPWQLKSSETMSHLITTPLVPLKTKLQELRNNAVDNSKCTEKDSFDFQDKPEVNVNFFSLTIGGQGEKQRQENEKDQRMGNMQNVEPTVPLFFSKPVKTCTSTMDLQPVLTPTFRKISSSEEEEEMEEDFSGYLKRNETVKRNGITNHV